MAQGVTRAALVLRVVDAAGRPVAGARLALLRASVPFPEVALVADDDGRATLFLPEGVFAFRAHAPDGRTGEAEVTGGSAGEVAVEVEGRAGGR